MLIKSGADVNSAREDGETAIHMAARKGNLKTFKLLLDEGGDSRTQSKVSFISSRAFYSLFIICRFA